jgi:hypothetical protein
MQIYVLWGWRQDDSSATTCQDDPLPPASGREYINPGNEKRGESPLLHTTELVSLRSLLYRSVVGDRETLRVEGGRDQRDVAGRARPPPRRGAPGRKAICLPSAYSSLDSCAAKEREREIGRRHYNATRGARAVLTVCPLTYGRFV